LGVQTNSDQETAQALQGNPTDNLIFIVYDVDTADILFIFSIHAIDQENVILEIVLFLFGFKGSDVVTFYCPRVL
jgi:hypothetical protein